MMTWMNLNFQNPNSMNMIKIIMFHNFLLIILLNIIFILIFMMKFSLFNKFSNKIILQNQILEILWTLIPMVVILLISLLSINLLYLNNEMKNNLINIKIIGNQWFWNYEYPIFNKNFNSYLLINNNFNFMMLETDNNFIIPFNYQIMIILTSLDVIHSWTLPSMNIKMDCVPNQLNSNNLMMLKSSILYGQCSEICGIYHSFMPIKVESINFQNFIIWLNN